MQSGRQMDYTHRLVQLVQTGKRAAQEIQIANRKRDPPPSKPKKGAHRNDNADC